MSCKHSYEYTKRYFYCKKCGHHYYGKSHKQKKRGTKVGISIIVSIAVIGFLFFGGVIEIDQKNLENSVDTIFNEIPQIDEIKTTVEETSKDIIKNIEEEQARLEAEQRISDKKYIQDIVLKVHQLINEKRSDHGLMPLSWNTKIAQAALNHSTDMATRDYYEHDSPEGHDFTWRYSQVGFYCSIQIGNTIYGGAENIMWMEGYYGVDKIATTTVDGWMNSPGHRVNILTPYFQSEGIGVAFSGNKVYLTQNFC